MKLLLKTRLAGAALACALAAPGASFASGLNALEILNGMNLVVLGDADASKINHVEGAAYIGGTLTSSTFYANSRNQSEISLGGATGSLIVGGDVNAVLNAGGEGAIVIGGAHNGSSNAPNTTTTGVGVNKAGGVPVTEMKTLFTTLSDDLSAWETNTATQGGDSNNTTISSGAGNADGIAFLTLTETETKALFGNQNGNISFLVQSGVSLIINAAGKALDIRAKVNNEAPNVLVNFYEAETLNFSSSPFNTSLLAAYANVSSPDGGTRGSFVAGSLTMKGEIRPFNGDATGYRGKLPPVSEEPVGEVPLPPALPLMVAGFLSLAALRGRRAA